MTNGKQLLRYERKYPFEIDDLIREEFVTRQQKALIEEMLSRLEIGKTYCIRFDRATCTDEITRTFKERMECYITPIDEGGDSDD